MDNLGAFSPEKQQLLEKAFKIGKNVIYNKKIFGSVIEELDQVPPEVALAESIVMVLQLIEKDESIGILPFDVAMDAGLSILVDLVDALQETGRGPYSADVILNAVEHGTKMYLQMNGSRVNQDEMQQQIQQLQGYLGGGK